VCISWHLSPSQRRTSWIPPISLCACMCIPPIVARQRLGKVYSPFIARQRLGKQFPRQRIHATVEQLLDLCVCTSPNRCQVTTPSKSKSHYDRRPVGQCVLVSSPVWGSWPDVNYNLTVTVLSISGAPSDERSGSVICLSQLDCFSSVQ
jgi:hypothetical protein